MFDPQDDLTEARRTVAELEAIRDQFKPTDARSPELFRRGLAMLDADTTPEEWKSWLWDVHSTLRAHIAALRLAERAGNNSCANRQNAHSGAPGARQAVDLGI